MTEGAAHLGNISPKRTRYRQWHHARIAAIAFTLPLAAFDASRAHGETAPETGASQEPWAVHAQATYVMQGVPGFRSPYEGPNSLTPDQARETFDATVYAGVRPWAGAELWINPEVDQGFGLSDTSGAAGFPSAEALKVGKSDPYLRLQRLFLRQTIELGGTKRKIDGSANQFAGSERANRLVITVGKFAVVDVFDTNLYAHDPRSDFLNWSVVEAGTFDYAADAWGYTTGLAGEWYQQSWTVRIGAFNLSKVPNGETLERDFSQYQIDLELEHRHEIRGRPGAVRITLFRNRGLFGRFDDALAQAIATGGPADTGLVRRRRVRIGFDANVEQELSGTAGMFARVGIANGAIEPYDFTDIDRTFAIGGQLKGSGWGRATDTIGLAAVVNGISSEHERYLNAGGTGILVGDGKLPHPGREIIAEAYYKLRPLNAIELTADYQLIVHPAYNRDRGPASVLALRLHRAL